MIRIYEKTIDSVQTKKRKKGENREINFYNRRIYKNRKPAKSLRRLSFLTQTLQNYTIELIAA